MAAAGAAVSLVASSPPRRRRRRVVIRPRLYPRRYPHPSSPLRHRVIASTSPPLSSPATCEGTLQVVASCVVVASSSLQPAKQSFRSTMSLSSPVMSSIPSPQPCSPCHSRHSWQLPCGVTVHAKLLRVLGPRPRQRMRRAGWQSDSDSVATSRDRGPACDRSEGRSEEDGSEDRNVVEDCRGGSSEGRVRI